MSAMTQYPVSQVRRLSLKTTDSRSAPFRMMLIRVLSNSTLLISALVVCLVSAGCKGGGSGSGSDNAVSDSATVDGRQVAVDAANVRVVSPPVATKAPCIESEVLQERFLELVNEARSIARFCGDVQFAAAAPVTWSAAIETSALIHSIDMAENNFFAHIGSDGSHVGQRLTRQNFEWRLAVENVAAGSSTPEQTVDLWVSSAGHCENLMNPDVSEMAVSCADKEGSDFLRYWTQVLAAPSPSR